MKKRDKKIIIWILTAILVMCIFVNIFLFMNKPISEKSYEIKVIFGEKIGMVINDSIIDFGEIPMGLSSNRKLNFTNSYSFPIDVKIFIEGNISDYIYGDNEFTLNSGEMKTYDINLIAPGNVKEGEYNGKIYFRFYKSSSRYN